MQTKQCDFCGNKTSFVYKMGEYDIYKCLHCSTGFASPMPDKTTLKQLYDGFITHLNSDLYPKYKNIGDKLFESLGLERNKSLRMLDIGGGGGYFCKAFEELRFGNAVYVDLDPKSCAFAQKELKIKQVFNCDATKLDNHEKFDFIYCRHLIEHLTDPTNFITNIYQKLTPDGIFVLQFPNGDSIEYLAYPYTNIKYRIKKIKDSNGFSLLKTLYLMVSGNILHGMDPPRHLWAISRKGIKIWSKKNGIPSKIFTRNLSDPLYSPGFRRKKQITGILEDFIGLNLLSKIHGGTHSILILKK